MLNTEKHYDVGQRYQYLGFSSIDIYNKLYNMNKYHHESDYY